MTTQPRSPREHYTAAERLIAASEETPANAALLALAHGVLACAPRRARRQERHHARPGDSPAERWMFGRDDEEGGHG